MLQSQGGESFRSMGLLDSPPPPSTIVYFVANYRPQPSHFWLNSENVLRVSPQENWAGSLITKSHITFLQNVPGYHVCIGLFLTTKV